MLEAQRVGRWQQVWSERTGENVRDLDLVTRRALEQGHVRQRVSDLKQITLCMSEMHIRQSEGVGMPAPETRRCTPDALQSHSSRAAKTR